MSSPSHEPYRVRPLSEEEAAAAGAWRYDGQLSAYDGTGAPLRPEDGYWGVEDGDGTFIGSCCFGAEARVPGVDTEAGVLDVGVGIAPEHVGAGRSPAFLAAVIAFGLQRFAPARVRALVLDWNSRSLAAFRRAGLREVGVHEHAGRRFVVLERRVAQGR